jgi:histidine triad (HIT) family protein
MNITPEMKQQLEAQKAQCIFCKIISKEQESKIVFEDEMTLSILDIYPAIKGHTVAMLKEHYPIMPYIPANEFKHFFGLMPALCKAVKDAMVMTSINVFIASGGAAGQQAPHFLIHLFPREKGDSFNNFIFKETEELAEKEQGMLGNNFPIMMGNHFKRNPAKWHQGPGEIPNFLTSISTKDKVIYEDELVLVVIPKKGAVAGHLIVYSKTEESDIAKLSSDESAHFFYVASFAATAVFEGLGAQGSNIILKSGTSDDNPEGRLSIHILPRNPEDGLQGMLWKPEQPSYSLDDVKERIKDKTWKISYKKEEKKMVVTEPKITSSGNEIKDAIERLR